MQGAGLTRLPLNQPAPCFSPDPATTLATNPMTTERLILLSDYLESDKPIPPASRAWLRDSLRRWQAGLPLDRAFQLDEAHALSERNAILREHAAEIPASSINGRAKAIAAEAKRIHSGRRSRYGWIVEADRLSPLPETPRQYHSLLKR
jgi:hypothetical protein